MSVDIKDLLDELQVRDISAPLLLRFPDILDNRIEKISNCFDGAARQYGYDAKNYMIYPIKLTRCARWWKRSSPMAKNST